jgi:hypothetical protein
MEDEDVYAWTFKAYIHVQEIITGPDVNTCKTCRKDHSDDKDLMSSMLKKLRQQSLHPKLLPILPEEPEKGDKFPVLGRFLPNDMKRYCSHYVSKLVPLEFTTQLID